MHIQQLIAKIRNTPDCTINAPMGLPIVNEPHVLPDDLCSFYEACGGLSLFEKSEYPVFIVSPKEVVLANPIIVGELCEDDISSSWYIIAKDGNGEYLTIDLSKERLGRCYDSFFDRHGVPGSCPIIALSFTDLLARLYENKGQY